MRQLQEMFDTLLPTNEQEERMLCEILVARNGKPKRRSRNNPVRVAVLIAAALAMCVVTASAAEILGVSQMIRDYFQKKEEVSVMDKLNVAAKGLNTTTTDGWKITITDLLGDGNRWLLGVTVEAPDNTVLDRDDYMLDLSTEGTPDTMPESERQSLEEDAEILGRDVESIIYPGYLPHSQWRAHQVQDDNPKDNKVSFVLDDELAYYQDGIVIDLTFGDLTYRETVESDPVNPGQEPHVKREERVVKQFNSTIRGVATHFSFNGYHLTPNTTIKAFSGNTTVSKLTVTPLSISFEVSGDAANKLFIYSYEPDPKKAKAQTMKIRPTRQERFARWKEFQLQFIDEADAATKELFKHPEKWDDDTWWAWTNEWVLDTPLILHFKDGTSQEIDLYNPEGRHAHTDKDVNKKVLYATYNFETPLDLDTVDYITICDARISLPVEAVK